MKFFENVSNTMNFGPNKKIVLRANEQMLKHENVEFVCRI